MARTARAPRAGGGDPSSASARIVLHGWPTGLVVDPVLSQRADRPLLVLPEQVGVTGLVLGTSRGPMQVGTVITT